MVSFFYKGDEYQEIIAYIETQLDEAKQQARQTAVEDIVYERHERICSEIYFCEQPSI